MPKSDIRLQLVEDAYRAAIGQIDWQELIDNFSCFSGVKTNLVAHDAHFTDFDGYISSNTDPIYYEKFLDYYNRVNPWSDLVGVLGHMPKGSWCHHHMKHEELLATEFYQDWLRPQGNLATGYGINLVNESERHLSLLFVNSYKNMAEGLEIERVMLDVGGHIKRALELHRQLQGQKLRVNNYEHVLDHLHSAVLVTDGQARMSFANRQAEALLRRGNIISLDRNGTLKFIHPSHKRKVEQSLAGLSSQLREGAPFSVALEGVHGEGLLLFVAPIGFEPLDVNDFATFWRAPRQFAWFFVSPDNKPGSRLEIIMMVLQVTPAEAELALALLQDKTLKEHAEAKGITKNTVRAQMQALLNKTGCRRQAELVGKLNRLFAQVNL